MRITGGKARGKTLRFPSGSRERPTSDFLREALFNLLGSLDDKTFLDLYAGSGSVGLEAASRNARTVCFVEKDKRLAGVIKKNISACGQDHECAVMAADVAVALRDLSRKQSRFDIVFADPPYHRGLVEETLNLLNRFTVLGEKGVIVIQHSAKEDWTGFTSDHMRLVDQRKYGENTITFFKWRMNDAG